MQVLKCTRKKLEVGWIQKESLRIATILISKTSPRTVYLFGSAAEGTMTDQSDFDFLLIFETEKAIAEAQKLLRPYYPLSEYPVDLVWVTQEDFARKRHIGGICMVAYESGKCLYDQV